MTGWIWLVVVGFRVNTGWGIAVLLFIPLAAPIFAALHWNVARTPFLLIVGGTIMYLLLYFLWIWDIGP